MGVEMLYGRLPTTRSFCPGAHARTRQFVDVHLEDVGLDHAELGMLAQLPGQVAVQLDHSQVPQSLNQRLRQGRQPGPDLHHSLARPRRNRLDDAFDDALVSQEMLAEAFARDVLHKDHGLTPEPAGPQNRLSRPQSQ